ncbi:hypothetical protein K438DRAFT_1995373 [Mycena galopus ATCC 62051]|nr:hypothetical protein K438DRAFT_1995373 [Mycena galopus ATCC 62051]
MSQSSTTEAPQRRQRRTPLTADLALVPLINRRNHPEFQSRAPNTMNSSTTVPTLPSLHTANDVFFQDSLAKLGETLDRQYQSPAAKLPATKITEEQKVPEVHPTHSPTLYKSLVYIGLENRTSAATFSVVLPVLLPRNPFLAQIIKAVWQKTERIQTFTAKWTQARIYVAFSRRIIYIEAPGHSGPQTGFAEGGYFNDSVGDLADDIGGRHDVTVREVLEESGQSTVKELRDLYQVPEGGKHSPSISTTSRSWTLPHPTFAHRIHLYVYRTSHEHALTHAYLDGASKIVPELALCRAIGHYDFASAYKTYANVRLIPKIVGSLGGTWPKTGIPASASSTFGNHVNWMKRAMLAVDLLAKEQQSGRLENVADAITLRERGAQLHALIHATLLDPSSPGFTVPKAYDPIATVSLADTKAWVADIEGRFGSTSTSNRRGR